MYRVTPNIQCLMDDEIFSWNLKLKNIPSIFKNNISFQINAKFRHKLTNKSQN